MLALARKYRPRKFTEVSVQDHVSNTLKGAIAAGRIAHGYLLSGPRGVGKTTLARVLAMALNCEKGAPGGEPCGDCPSCQRIWQGSTSLDVVEIDAASNRGVDDARDLRERAMYAPSGEDRYKVYIVDEAHMLTREAWNALLKILEEPPPRVVFVFATTEPQKIAQAAAPVLSRLQRFDFKRIGAADIRARLESVLAAEQVTAEPEALAMISRAADGSMRDALSLADQVLAMGDGTLTAARTRDALGLVPEDEYIALLDIIADRRAAEIFPFVDRLADAGTDFIQFLAGLGEIIRAQLSIALGGEAADVSDTARQALLARKGRQEAADLLRMLNVIAEAEYRFKRSGQQQLLIETMLVRFALMDRSVDIEDVLKAIGGPGGGPSPGRAHEPSRREPEGSRREPEPVRRDMPPRASSAPPPAPVRVSPAPSPAPTSLAPEISKPSHAKVAPDIHAVTGRWDELIARVKSAGKVLLGTALESSSPAAINKDGVLTIRLDEPNDFHAKAIEQARPDLVAMLDEWFAGLREVRLLRDDAPQVTTERPARVTDEMVKAQRLNTLRRKDPGLDAAIDVLDLEIVE